MVRPKNFHLIVSSFGLIPVALAYGAAPAYFLPLLVDFQVQTIDLTHVFRATMGLYLSISIFWMIGIVKERYWEAATISNIVLMTGLALGRLMSFLVDGIPSPVLTIGLILEVMMALWGFVSLRTYRDADQ